MDYDASFDTTTCQSGTITGNKPNGKETPKMSKDDRKQLVLEYLSHTGLALPPLALYRNLRLQQNATFSEKTLHNYLDELAADGLVTRIDPEAMEERRVVQIDSGRGYWMVTDAGRDEAGDSFSFH